MDVESPRHLERFRDQPEIKAALLRAGPTAADTEARFERSARNTDYWAPILALSSRFLATGRSEALREPIEVYGRPCWLIATSMGPAETGPYSIALAAADGASSEDLVRLLLDVSHDYWHGSYFWK